jgi:flagellar biogenesis protein FliO
VSTEMFFASSIFLFLLGLSGVFFSYQRRKVYPIVLIALTFFLSGGWGFTRLANSSTPRNDPALEAVGIYVPLDTTPTAMEAFEAILTFFSSVGLIIGGVFAIILAISRSERNRLRREARSHHHRSCA